MGVKVREVPGKGWYVFINWKSQRKAKAFGKNKVLAKDFASKIEARLKLGDAGLLTHSGITLEAYTETWLDHIRHTRKPSTAEDYKKRLNQDIYPILRTVDLRSITRERVKAVALAGFTKNQAPKTVQNTVRVLSSLLSHAKEDGLISDNAALRPGRILPKISKRREINPLTREELAMFLSLAKEKAPRLYPLFLCAARTGLRQGELLALQWDDLNFSGRFLEISRSFTHGEMTTPKNGESRRGDLSRELTETLKALQIDRQLEAVMRGWENQPAWVFCDEQGVMLRHNTVRQTFHTLLKDAGVRRIRFHDLRHTFASLLLQNNESLVYVKEQMGHSSIQVTVDLYGHLIPGGNKQAVDRLDLPVDKPRLEGASATPAQPREQSTQGGATEGLEDQPVTKKRYGVSARTISEHFC
jgi:integrase